MGESSASSSQLSDEKKWTVAPKDLKIKWSEDKRYWNISQDGAELLHVCWLEVTGTKDLVEGGKYDIGFKVSLKQGASGWNEFPVYMMAKVGKRGKSKWKRINELMTPPADPRNPMIIPNGKFQITVDQNDSDKTIHFGLYEVWSGTWKEGLIIHEATIEKVN